MRASIRSAAAGLLAISVLAGPSARAAKYEIHQLEATFELVPNLQGELRDLSADIWITLQPLGDPFALGGDAVFTFERSVGHQPIRNVSVSDPQGTPLHFSTHSRDERSYLKFSFRMLESALTTAVVRLVMVNALMGNPLENHLEVDWLPSWSRGASTVVYRFLLPENHPLDQVVMEPDGAQRLVHQGRPAIEGRWPGPRVASFAVRFSPGVAPGRLHVSGQESGILVGALAGIGLLLAVVGWVIWRLTARRRPKDR